MVKIFEPLVDLQDKQLNRTWYKNAASLIAQKTSARDLMRDGKLLQRPSAVECQCFSMTLKRNKTTVLRYISISVAI